MHRRAVTRRGLTVTCGGFAVAKSGLTVVHRVHPVASCLSQFGGVRVDFVRVCELVTHTRDEVTATGNLIALPGQFVALARQSVADLAVRQLVSRSVLRVSLHATDFMQDRQRRR
jgi:hypothetical protein